MEVELWNRSRHEIKFQNSNSSGFQYHFLFQYLILHSLLELSCETMSSYDLQAFVELLISEICKCSQTGNTASESFGEFLKSPIALESTDLGSDIEIAFRSTLSALLMQSKVPLCTLFIFVVKSV